MHFGSCCLCDACWESWFEPASGCGRIAQTADARTQRGAVGLGKGRGRSGARRRARSSGGGGGVGGLGSERARERRGWWRRSRGLGKRRGPGLGSEPGHPPAGPAVTRPWPGGGSGGGACARLGADAGGGRAGGRGSREREGGRMLRLREARRLGPGRWSGAPKAPRFNSRGVPGNIRSGA